MILKNEGTATFCGRSFTQVELEKIREIATIFSGLSRTEIAGTVCESLSRYRPNGAYKDHECRIFLEHLEEAGFLKLPAKRRTKPKGSRTKVPRTREGESRPPLSGSVEQFTPVIFKLVKEESERNLWRELIDRYHYLGCKVPFGAHLRYLFYVTRPEISLAGCPQFSSLAWRIACRDEWIGWDAATRCRNLQHMRRCAVTLVRAVSRNSFHRQGCNIRHNCSEADRVEFMAPLSLIRFATFPLQGAPAVLILL